LCQKTCDVPFGITAIDSVSAPPDGVAPPPLQAASAGTSASASSARVIQPPESLGVAAEHRVTLVRRERRHVVGDERHRRRVVGCNRTDRPVRSNHHPPCPEAVEYDVEAGADLSGRPVLPAGFGHEARRLAQHVRVRGESAQIALPLVQVAGPDWRLRCVIENEALIGEAGDELLSYGQMAAIYKDVVAEPER